MVFIFGILTSHHLDEPVHGWMLGGCEFIKIFTEKTAFEQGFRNEFYFGMMRMAF